MPRTTNPSSETEDGELYPVPSDDTFEQEDAEFLPAFDLERVGQRLIAECSELAWLSRYPVAYLWKRSGTVSNQKQILGTCSKTSGKLRHFAKVVYVIEIAADFCRDHHLTYRQMEALVFHELNHPIELMDDKGTLKPSIVGHDLECFWDEYRRYGAWRLELTVAERVFAVQTAFGEGFAENANADRATPTERLAAAMGQQGIGSRTS